MLNLFIKVEFFFIKLLMFFKFNCVCMIKGVNIVLKLYCFCFRRLFIFKVILLILEMRLLVLLISELN